VTELAKRCLTIFLLQERNRLQKQILNLDAELQMELKYQDAASSLLHLYSPYEGMKPIVLFKSLPSESNAKYLSMCDNLATSDAQRYALRSNTVGPSRPMRVQRDSALCTSATTSGDSTVAKKSATLRPSSFRSSQNATPQPMTSKALHASQEALVVANKHVMTLAMNLSHARKRLLEIAGSLSKHGGALMVKKMQSLEREKERWKIERCREYARAEELQENANARSVQRWQELYLELQDEIVRMRLSDLYRS
jgi:hypothetical protein